MTNSNDDSKAPELGGTWRDTGVAIAKGGIGAIPIVGSVLGELVGVIIPNQRLARIEDYLRLLTERLDGTPQDKLNEKFKHADVVDVFEDGALQTVRALSNERKEYVANIVAHGISGEDKDRIEAKRLLKLLEEIDDEQIIILSSNLRKNRNNNYFKLHENVLLNTPSPLNSIQSQRDKATVRMLAESQLINLGLLQPRFKRPNEGQMPDFDMETGMMRVQGIELTALGRLLLTRMGISKPGEF